MPKQALSLVRELAFPREETQVVQPRAPTGRLRADFDLNDGRECDGNPTIGTFLDSRMDVFRRGPDGDGGNA
jgi:hypothetical protein